MRAARGRGCERDEGIVGAGGGAAVCISMIVIL